MSINGKIVQKKVFFPEVSGHFYRKKSKQELQVRLIFLVTFYWSCLRVFSLEQTKISLTSLFLINSDLRNYNKANFY